MELAVERPGHALGDAGLAHPGGPVQQDDAALGGALQLAHGDELQQALLGGTRKAGQGETAQGTMVQRTERRISEMPHNLIREPSLLQYTRGESSERLFEAAANGGV